MKKGRVDPMLQEVRVVRPPREPAVSIRRGARGVLPRFALVLLLSETLSAAAADRSLAIRVAGETVPAGGGAQIKVLLAAPALVGNGSLSMDLDPAVFGDITGVAVFSAAGDQIGFAKVNGRHVEARFSSPSGGIGQLPDLPVFAVSAPVLAGTMPGATTSVTFDPGASAWKDHRGSPYSVTVQPGTFTVGGELSVASVVPGGGLLPTGAVVEIGGTGFNPTTAVSIDGVSVSSVLFAGPKMLKVTLGAPAEITGKRVRVTNSNGTQVDFYPAFPSSAANDAPRLAGVHPILPLATYAEGATETVLGYPATLTGLALLNQNPSPVDVALQCFGIGGESIRLERLTIPGGTLYLLDADALVNYQNIGGVHVTASGPIRMLQYRESFRLGSHSVGVWRPLIGTTAPPIKVFAFPESLFWSWQKGAPLPDPLSVHASGSLPFTVSVSGGQWLTATPSEGKAPSSLTVAVNPSSLNPGEYKGTVTIAPQLAISPAGFPVESTTINVSLTVSAEPLVDVSWIDESTVRVTSNGNPASFKATVSTERGGDWLSVTPSSGTTPATLTLAFKREGLAIGNYTGSLTISGPANNVTIPVSMSVSPPIPPGPRLYAYPMSLSFLRESGVTPPLGGSQSLSVQPYGVPVTVSVETESGGDWLTADNLVGPPLPTVVSVNASAANLAPGLYRGAVILSSAAAGSIRVPVKLLAWSAPPPGTRLAVTPPSISFSAEPGQIMRSQPVMVDSGAVQVAFDLGWTTADDPRWLSAAVETAFEEPSYGYTHYAAPAVLNLTAYAGPPGSYYGNLGLSWSNGSVDVPVTLSVTATPDFPPILAAIVNAASQTSGAISPGEIVTIHGTGIGPPPVGLRLDDSGKVATDLDGTRVLINGVAAPLLYASPTQLNAIVPYEAGTAGIAKIQVESNGVKSVAWGVPLRPSAPGIFTTGATGRGQAAVLNQDNSPNGPANPARPGTAIQIFATGEGLTSPPSLTGSITPSSVSKPLLPVTVTIGGLDAPVEFQGSAPYSVAGLLQVNARVPENLTAGTAVPIVLTIGGVRSPDSVTIAVK